MIPVQNRRFVFYFSKLRLVVLTIGSIVMLVLTLVLGLLIGYRWGKGASEWRPTQQRQVIETVRIDSVKTTKVDPPPLVDTLGATLEVVNYDLNTINVLPDTLVSMDSLTLAGRYVIQVGAFVEKGRAETRVVEVQKRGYTPYIFTARNPANGKEWYMVRLGLFGERRKAWSSARQISSMFKVEPYVSRFGQF